MTTLIPTLFNSMLAAINNRKKTILKKALTLAIFVSLCSISYAQGYTYVNGYYRSNGTYVQGHYRTLPNDTRNDNWSTVGNVNPFTGEAGTKPRDSYYSSSNSTYSSNYYNSTPSYSNYNTSSYNSTYYSTPSYNNTYSRPSYSGSSYYSNSYSSGYRYSRY